jgi:hypothetical protein
MNAPYRERPEIAKRVIVHEPFPRSAAIVIVLQLLMMMGGFVSTTLSAGRRTTLACDHRVATCEVSTDARIGGGTTTTSIPIASIVEARVVAEPLSKGTLARLGIVEKGGTTVIVGSEPHDPIAVADHERVISAFLRDAQAPSLVLAIDVEGVRPSTATFVSVAAVLLLPLAVLLAVRRSARVELDGVERSLSIIRRRGPFPARSTRVRLDDLRAARLERKPGTRLAHRVVLEKKNGERIPLVHGWSPHAAAQQRTIDAIGVWIEE